ncbi:MAG: asparagine synthase C-terminal domain-containing protein, partial [Planctomycetales bacterium]
FGGYQRYQTVAKVGQIDSLPRWLRRLVGNRLWDVIPAPNRQASMVRRLCERMRLLRESPERRYVNWVAHFNDARRQALYHDSFAERLQDEDATQFFVEAISKCSKRCAGSQAMLADLQTYLPCDLLVKVDIASMSHGLECRSPFLDHRVVELATAIPYAEKISGRETKRILKQTFSNLIPPEIARRPKMGFSIPLDHWFRHELKSFVSGVLLDPISLERGYFRPDAVRQLITEHNAASWDHSQRLWSLLCLELWQRTFIDPATAPVSAPATLQDLVE